jgi:hypothetical protein
MEDEVKKLMKTLKDMKVEKKANAYGGILEEIKKWLIFLPLVSELADPAMRPRHWDSIKVRLSTPSSLSAVDSVNWSLVTVKPERPPLLWTA